MMMMMIIIIIDTYKAQDRLKATSALCRRAAL